MIESKVQADCGGKPDGASVSLRCHRMRAAASAVYYTAALAALAASLVLLVSGFRSGSRTALAAGTVLLFAAFGLCTNRCCLGQLLGAPPTAAVAGRAATSVNQKSPLPTPLKLEESEEPSEATSPSTTVAAATKRSLRLAAAAAAMAASATTSPPLSEPPPTGSPTSSPPLTPRRAPLGVNGLLLGGRRCSAFGLGPGDPAARLSLMRQRSTPGSVGSGAAAVAAVGAAGSGGRRMSSALQLAASAGELAGDGAGGCWMPAGGLGDFVEFA